jgi:hypothetical protein
MSSGDVKQPTSESKRYDMTMKEAFPFFEMVMSYEQAKRGGRWVWFARCADTTPFLRMFF